MRTLSTTLKRAMFAPQTGEVLTVLLVLSHPELPEAIRVNNAGADVVSGGLTYQAFPFEINMPAENEDSPPSATLAIDGIDRRIVLALRSISSTPTVSVSVVLASAPDVVEIGPMEFELQNASYSARSVQGELRYEPILGEPYPAESFTPSRTPGLFRSGGSTS